MKKNHPVTGIEKSFSEDANILSITNPKGVITYTNEDFNEIAGFSAEELLGKNHNIVRHPDMPPAAFADLWENIKAGRNWMGIVKNRCKNGDHYWVDAFVTPILEDGKIVEYQSVRSKPERHIVERAEQLYAQLNEGKLPLALRLPSLSLNNKLLASFSLGLIPLIGHALQQELDLLPLAITTLLSLAVAYIGMRLLTRPLNKAIQQARDKVRNPLMQYVYTGHTDEAGELLLAMKMHQSELGAILGRVSDSSLTLSRNAEHLAVRVEETGQDIQRQQAETDQVAKAINEMSTTIQEVANHAGQTAEAATAARGEAAAGMTVVQDTRRAIETLAGEVDEAAAVIEQLRKDSDDITTVLEVIGGIAEQTNLLALNAAIEAARAGEQGRGFAVVADEVRTLASRTQGSTREINAMIERLQTAARKAVEVMGASRDKVASSVNQAGKAANSLQSITDAVNIISDMSAQIATAVEQQSAMADEVNRSITTIRATAEHTTVNSEAMEKASRDMAGLATDMRQLVHNI